MACNVLGCREIYLAACPVVSPACSITHIYAHPTHLGQAPYGITMRFKSNCRQGSWSKDSSLSRWFPKTSGPDAGEACFAVRRRKSVLLLPGFSPGGGGMR